MDSNVRVFYLSFTQLMLGRLHLFLNGFKMVAIFHYIIICNCWKICVVETGTKLFGVWCMVTIPAGID